MRLLDCIASGPALVDGGWGAELQKLGLAAGDCPDSWNLSQPGKVAEVARSYVEAGSRIILTNTFRSNRIALEPHGLAGDLSAINAAGVRISREAAQGRALVFASLGPTGKVLAAGDITEAEALAAYREQAAALAAAGADALIVETMSDLSEASLALAAARETGLPAIVSFTFDSGRNKDRTMMGVTPEQAAGRMTEEGASAVGANCGMGIEAYVPICRRLRAATALPLWIKPNAGLPEYRDGRTVYGPEPEWFASFVPALVEAGANFIGGCCGAGPDFVRACARSMAALCA